MTAFNRTFTSTKTTAATSPETPRRSITDAAFDRILVSRFLQGDETAFVEIMERHRSKIFAVALGLLHNHADAEEITQDTFIRAHRGLANFRGDSSLATWLFRISVNLSRNRYWFFFRRHRQDSLSLDFIPGGEGTATFSDLVADVVPNPAQETVTLEFARLVERCMGCLDASHQEILNLRNVLNLSYGQIAAKLTLNVGTVKSRIARARENLRKLLVETCPEFAPDASLNEWFLPARGTYGAPAIACA